MQHLRSIHYTCAGFISDTKKEGDISVGETEVEVPG